MIGQLKDHIEARSLIFAHSVCLSSRSQLGFKGEVFIFFGSLYTVDSLTSLVENVHFVYTAICTGAEYYIILAAALFSSVFFLVGSLACGLSQSFRQLVSARAIAGIGGGGMLAMSSIVSADLVSLRYAL